MCMRVMGPKGRRSRRRLLRPGRGRATAIDNPAAWRTDGEFVLDNEGCGVAVERMSWDKVKSLYR